MHDSLIYAEVIYFDKGGVAGNAIIQFPAILLFVWMHIWPVHRSMVGVMDST